MKRRVLLLAISTLLGLAFLVTAVAHLDRAAVARALTGARLWPWLPLALVSYLGGQWLRGFRLRLLLHPEVEVTTTTATNVVVVGYAVNNILPARLGELVRAWILMERSGLSIVQTLTITLVERLLDAAVLLALFGIAILAVTVAPTFAAAVPLAGGLLLLIAIVLAFGIWAPGTTVTFTSRATQRLFPSAHDRVVNQVHAALGGLEALRHLRSGLAVLGWSLAVWIAETGLYLFLLPAFGLAANAAHALFAMTSTNLGLLLPSTPGFIGTFHFFCEQALAAVGVPRSTGFGYAVLVHATFFVPVTIWGLASLAGHGLSIGRALALTREARPLPAGAARLAPRTSAPPDPLPSRFLLALTEAAVPLDRDGLDVGTARAVTGEVATFVAGQIRELPMRLRTLFQIGLLGFRLVTRLRFARGYCELPPTVRRAWFERWAYGSFALGRQLLRPVRSTALLAYYEQPAARAALDRAATAHVEAAS